MGTLETVTAYAVVRLLTRWWIMVDLTYKGSHDYWSQFPDSSVYKAIVFVESQEQAFLDGDKEYEEAIEKLGDALDLMSTQSIDDHTAVMQVLACMKTSRYLRLLQGMDGISPGAASKVIQAAERSDPLDALAQLFLRRNIVFERYRLLQRLLAPERLKLLSQVLETG